MSLLNLVSWKCVSVESGFSVNEQLLKENMMEISLIAQHVVYEGIMADGGILNVDINESMMQYVKKQFSMYGIALEKGRENQNEIEKKRAARKRLCRYQTSTTGQKK